MSPNNKKQITIVGAGFAGITTAQRLAKNEPDTAIRIINPTPYFQYYPAMYRVVTGSSPLVAFIPLAEIFERYSNVEIVEDMIVEIDTENKRVIGQNGEVYDSDYLLIAVGSQNTFFNIEGVAEVSFNFKSIHQAMRLRARVTHLFKESVHMEPEEKLKALHFVIVGGGPSGVELAGELAQYTRDLASKQGIPESFITIDLIEAAPRILPAMTPEISERTTHRLRSIGVNVLANRMLVRSETEKLFFKDMEIGAKTLIWTAGVRAHKLFETLTEFSYDGKGRVVVDEYMQAKGYSNIFIAGDNASTDFSGLAQTAIHDGEYIADAIQAKMNNTDPESYRVKTVSYDVPVGPGWGVLVHKGMTIYGRIAWWVRHLIDLKFFLSILPFRQALRYFFSTEMVHDKMYVDDE